MKKNRKSITIRIKMGGKKSSTIRIRFNPSIPAEALFNALGFPCPSKPKT